MAFPSKIRSLAFNFFYDGQTIKDEDILTSMFKNLNSFRADKVYQRLKKELMFKIFMFSSCGNRKHYILLGAYNDSKFIYAK